MKVKDVVKTTSYIIFSDLDGVMADFEAGVSSLLGEPLDQNRYEVDSTYRGQMWDAVREHSDNGGELWYDLPLMADAMVLWNYIHPHSPSILTATGNPKFGAGDQKLRWVGEKLGHDVDVTLVRKAQDKQLHATEGAVLIDDKEKAIDPWIGAGGIGVLHTSAANTIKQLQQLGI